MSRRGCPNKHSRKIQYQCKYCKKVWLDYPSRIVKKKYCSGRCRSLDGKTLFCIGNQINIGRKHSIETKQKISKVHKGKIRPNISKAKMGSKNPMWKGGTTPINKRIRRSTIFFRWRKQVFERDNYTCQECNKRGGVLHPHHIKAFATFPELRFELTNGVTLCEQCHKKTENFGNKLPKEQK